MSVSSGLQPAPGSDRPQVGLTLSGGGFRATLFHLGVVRFLYEEKQLHNVTHICSVSGGSILAAHLGLNWERYTSADETEFNAAARELVDFVRSDVRGRVVRSWLFSWVALGLPRLRKCWWWRTHLLQREYDRLYRGAKLKKLAAHDRPQLHLLATSFTTGHLVTFGRGEMRFCGELVPDPPVMPAEEVPVSLAVASSSAFPPLFPPVRVDHATFGAPKGMFPDRHYMTDGGVFDNLGLRGLFWLVEPGKRFDVLVISDAQRSLEKEYGHEYNLTLGRTARCVDLMMDRVSWFESTAAHEVIKEDGRLVWCKLPKRPEDRLTQTYAPSTTEQYAVATARTDLDSFTDDEIDAIVHEGYATARFAAEAKGVCGAWPADGKVWHPARPDRIGEYQLKGIEHRKLGLFRASHWATWALWGLVALWAAVPLALFVYQSLRAEEQSARADDAEKQLLRAEKYMMAVRMLGDVALARNDDERYEARKKDWKGFRDALEKDPTFKEFLSSEEIRDVERAVIQKKPSSLKETEKKVRELTRRAETTLKKSGGEAYLELQRQPSNKRALYQDALEAVDQITNYEQLKQTRNSRRQFWRLYWGPLVLVSEPGTKQALTKFAEVLGDWEDKVKDKTNDYDLAQDNDLKKRLRDAAGEMRQAFEKEVSSLPNSRR